jgi:hypothetical protein
MINTTAVRFFSICFVSLLATTGCEEKKQGFTVGQKSEKGDCEASLDNLGGTEWVYLRANPDRTDSPDPVQGRIQFSKDGKELKYNVSSRSDMYDFTCVAGEKEMTCREEAKVKDFCQALVAGGAECNAAALKAIDSTLTDAQVTEGITKAEEVIAKFTGTDKWENFKFNNNNLGNKLQGLLYIKIDKRRCALRITDNYLTVYDGKKVEDSNPNGTNVFVKNEADLLWEHCTDAQDLIALEAATFPKDPAKVAHLGRHKAGKDVNFWYLGADAMNAPEGCSYNYDLWLNAQSLSKGNKPTPSTYRRKPMLEWHFTHKWDAATPTPPIITMVRNKDCGGKSEVEEVSCVAVLIQ